MQREVSPVVRLDPQDQPGVSDELERRGDIASGVVVVRPVPGVSNTRRLAADVLIAMGKHYDALSRERQSSHGWGLARLWMRAERVRHLVVCDADRLPSRLRDELGVAAATTGCHLWLVDTVEPGSPQPTVRGTDCSARELLSQLPVRTDEDAASLDENLLLPEEGFLTFRWACRHRLSAACFAEVDAVYVEAHRTTSSWLDSRRSQDRPGNEEVARQLRAITSPSRSSAETVVRLRAAQAAYFRNGVLVEIDEVTSPGPLDVPAVGLNPLLSLRLRRLVTPAWTCALALAAAGGFNTTALAALRLDNLSPDGQLLTVAGRSIEVAPHAAGLVRAQVLARRDAGAGPDDPLLVNAGGAFNAFVLGRRLEDAARLAATWGPHDERRPRWRRPAVAGHSVTLLALNSNWRAAARP